MSSSETHRSTDLQPEVETEVRQLITDLRDAARDGRLLADRFAELLKRTVEEYCVEFELRADDLLVRLEQSR
jgi:signal transduction histidine kinase